MTSADFAAAQQRVILRRQLRETEARNRQELQQAQRASSSITRLPFPIEILANRGLATWDILQGRGGTRPAFRVGQVDAELLDEELLELLKGQVGEGLKYVGPHILDDWSSEVLLALRAVLFKLSIWDHNASYGAALQNLRYTDARHTGPVPRLPSKWQKALYGLITVGGPYVWSRWEVWLVDQEGGYEGPSENVRRLSRLSSLISTTHSTAAFASFLIFLVNGRYRTLLDRILRVRLTPPNNQISREVSFEYLNRQLVWHAFTEFLLFLLPLVGIGRWRRWLARGWRKVKLMVKFKDEDGIKGDQMHGEIGYLPERTCAICYQDQNPTSMSENDLIAVTGTSGGGVIGSAQTDITNPYETVPCACIYCFVCIATKLEAEEGEAWTCLRCGELIQECRPWNGDVVGEVNRPSNGKSVSFSDEEGNQMDTAITTPESDELLEERELSQKEPG
ncbi:peroxisome assembly protein (Peroxin-2) [Bachmanniomyces sp. S44760]|nr:peroxisome assembly protein (Peroxin-2) [Bachmanniomyces sp. S44760]